MKRKKSNLGKILGGLLILSLCGNLVFSVLFVQLSRSTSQKVEVLAKKMEEFSMLMQERQDSMDNEGTSNGKITEEESNKRTDTGEETEKEKTSIQENSPAGSAAEVKDVSENPSEGMSEDGSEKKTEGASENTSENPSESLEVSYFSGPMPELVEKYISAREAGEEKWAVSLERLKDGTIYEYNGGDKMQSASVIKVFIMGTVYDRMCYPSSADRLIYAEESYEGELRYLLEQMITISDNNAANRLIEMLGEGDFSKGAQVVNEFCRENGYVSTSVGRRFLEENPSGDNYTSAADCRKILTDIYQGKCVGEEASGKMLDILKQQTNTVKIPSGLPSGIQTANKTGEMPEGYGLGCIENDMAVIYSEKGDYVLTVLSNNLGGRNEEAKQVIREISAYVWNWDVSENEDGEQRE